VNSNLRLDSGRSWRFWMFRRITVAKTTKQASSAAILYVLACSFTQKYGNDPTRLKNEFNRQVQLELIFHNG